MALQAGLADHDLQHPVDAAAVEGVAALVQGESAAAISL
jgi:hypothetical protein